MTLAQRDLLVKTLADVAKGLFVAAPIAWVTGKLSFVLTLGVMAVAVLLFICAYWLAAGGEPDA